MVKTLQHGGMYTATPCDECGGPTIALPSGSIWCSNEDKHPGGHFVVRVAFERSPLKAAAKPVTSRPAQPIKSRGMKPQAPVTVQKSGAFSGGYDDFVGSED